MSELSSTMLVPMYLDALMITPHQAKGGPQFDRWQMNYKNLQSLVSPMAPPFSDEFSTPSPGMNLQWILPAGLRRGEKDPTSGKLTYPFAPNRWLVVRMQPASSSPPQSPATKAWVLISDDIGDSDSDSNPFVDPQQAAKGLISPTNIGRRRNITLHDWNTEAGSAAGPPRS